MTEFGEGASPAVLFVQEGHNKFLAKAETTLEQAMAQINALAHFTTTATAFNVDFDFNDQLTPFVRPPPPSLDASEFNLRPQEDPAAPAAFEPQTPDIAAPIAFNVPDPTLNYGAKPDRPNVLAPTAPPRPGTINMPVAPDYASRIPEPVTLLSLNLPVFAPLVLPEFTSTRPGIQAFSFNDNFNFTPEAYVSALLTKIQARVSTWMDGQEALPAAIQRALFDRGRSQVVIETQAEIDAAFEEFSTRGFSQPQPMLAARTDNIRQAGQNRIADFNREATIKAFDEALANMRLAVSSGIQLEGVTINLHLEEQRLLLASASYLRDTSIAVLNARIAQFNAEMQAYGIDAQVFETQLKAALSKLEEYRLQLEAEKLKGDLNDQTVKLYTAQWEAVRTMASFYATQLEGVKVQAELAKLPIEIFSEEVKAFDAQMGAYGKDVDAYRAGVEAEGAKANVHRSLVEAFATRSRAQNEYGNLQIDREKLRIAEHGQKLETYGKNLARLDALLNIERARLGAVGQKAGAEATIFRAQADVEQAASAAADRSFELGLSAAKSRVDTQLETAKIKSSENIALQGLILEAMKAIATILSQLAASTMSAVNYSASVSASDGYSHSRSVGWSGDAEDWNSSFV
jgi:hypothetical protein